MVTKISIITPIFNGARFIMEAANSILAQSFADWEWIIVNDGSTDRTADLLRRLDDPRIRVLHQSNSGVSAARNAGIDAARGDYVTFLDADDTLPPEALDLRARFLDAHPEIDIVNGGVLVTSAGRTVRCYRPDMTPGPMVDRLARLEEGVFFGPFYMLRRDCLGQHRFPVGVSHCEDLIFFLTLAAERGLSYGAVEDIVYEYRINPGSAMSNLDGVEAGYLEFLRRAAALPGICQASRDYQVHRVRQIVFRSWLRRGRPFRAIAAALKIDAEGLA